MQPDYEHSGLPERDDQFDELADIVARVVDQALELSRAAKTSTGQLATASTDLSRAVGQVIERLGALQKSIPEATYTAVSQQFHQAAEQAAKSITGALSDANAAAARAAATYRSAADEALQSIREETRLTRERRLYYLGGGFAAGMIACVALVALVQQVLQ